MCICFFLFQKKREMLIKMVGGPIAKCIHTYKMRLNWVFTAPAVNSTMWKMQKKSRIKERKKTKHFAFLHRLPPVIRLMLHCIFISIVKRSKNPSIFMPSASSSSSSFNLFMQFRFKVDIAKWEGKNGQNKINIIYKLRQPNAVCCCYTVRYIYA